MWFCSYLPSRGEPLRDQHCVPAYTHTPTNNTWTFHNCTFCSTKIVNELLRRSRLLSARKAFAFVPFKLYINAEHNGIAFKLISNVYGTLNRVQELYLAHFNVLNVAAFPRLITHSSTHSFTEIVRVYGLSA